VSALNITVSTNSRPTTITVERVGSQAAVTAESVLAPVTITAGHLGPAGPAGPTGPEGPMGEGGGGASVWLGVDPPPDPLPGSLWLYPFDATEDTAPGIALYGWDGTDWQPVGGDAGPPGPTGPPGAYGLAGIQGTLPSIWDFPDDPQIGHGYIIDGELWIYQGPSGG